VLDAAVKLVERQGIGRTTLAQIGAMAGYSYGLVNHRFGTKQELVRAVTLEAKQAFSKELSEVERRPGLDAILALAERYLRAVAAHQGIAVYVLIGEALGSVPEIRKSMAAGDARFRNFILKHVAGGIAAREIRADSDPDALAAIIVGTIRGLAIQRLLSPSAFDLDSVCRELKRSLRLSLAVRTRWELES